MGVKFIAPAAILTLICGVAALALAAVQNVTTPVIAQQERLFRLRSIAQSIPRYDNEPDQDVVTVVDGAKRVCVFRGRQGGEVSGVAFEWTQGGGYSGDVRFLVGLTADGSLACNDGGDARWVGLQVLQHAETPGLGANMGSEEWRRQFCGHDLDDGETFWQVRKDGGQVDSLTGATITSRVVTSAIVAAMQFFRQHRSEIVDGEPGTCAE
jgi:electron transport complex protein RnfG